MSIFAGPLTVVVWASRMHLLLKWQLEAIRSSSIVGSTWGSSWDECDGVGLFTAQQLPFNGSAMISSTGIRHCRIILREHIDEDWKLFRRSFCDSSSFQTQSKAWFTAPVNQEWVFFSQKRDSQLQWTMNVFFLYRFSVSVVLSHKSNNYKHTSTSTSTAEATNQENVSLFHPYHHGSSDDHNWINPSRWSNQSMDAVPLPKCRRMHQLPWFLCR